MEFNVTPSPKIRSKNRVFPKAFELSHRKCPSSLSSSSSSNSSSSQYFLDDSLFQSSLSQSTPLRFSTGVPFSWEKLPGIPKAKQSASSSLKLSSLLPLPPSITPRNKPNNSNNSVEDSFRKIKCSPEWDPFVAALVECSKEDGNSHEHDQHDVEPGRTTSWSGAKITRSISDRFGFIGLSSSCKRSCTVDESIIYAPRQRRSVTTSNSSYGLIKYQRH